MTAWPDANLEAEVNVDQVAPEHAIEVHLLAPLVVCQQLSVRHGGALPALRVVVDVERTWDVQAA
jgi:hypothetical protein